MVMVTHLVGLVTSLTRSPGGHSYKISTNGLPVVYDVHPCKLEKFGGVSKETVQVGITLL